MTNNQKEIVRKGYDKLSYAYRSDDATDDEGFYTEWVNCLKEKIPAGSPVLDIGCGCGLPATKLLSECFEVTGVDFSEVQIKRAKKLVPSAKFICSDIDNAQFSSRSFAAVVSFYTIIHIPLDEHQRILMHIADWLQPNGYLMIIVGHKAWTGSEDKYLGVEGGEMRWSHKGEETYTKWISESGLKVLWKRFIPEGKSGHTLVFAQKPNNTGEALEGETIIDV